MVAMVATVATVAMGHVIRKGKDNSRCTKCQ